MQAFGAETEDQEEVYYCYVWCHLLDKNYSMMLGRSHCLLDYEGVELAFSHPFNKSMSALLTTYLHFVPIQALFVSELHPSRIGSNRSLVSGVESIIQDLLERLQRIHARITAVSQKCLFTGSWLILVSYMDLRTHGAAYISLVN